MDNTVRRSNGAAKTRRAKNKNSRTFRYHVSKKRRLRLLFIKVSFTLFIFISSVIIIRTLYINNRCKDINYAVNYYLTSSSAKENRLLRVKTLKTIYQDETMAEVIASGLEDSSPHKYSSYKLYFKKGSGGYWLMESISPVNEE